MRRIKKLALVLVVCLTTGATVWAALQTKAHKQYLYTTTALGQTWGDSDSTRNIVGRTAVEDTFVFPNANVADLVWVVSCNAEDAIDTLIRCSVSVLKADVRIKVIDPILSDSIYVQIDSSADGVTQSGMIVINPIIGDTLLLRSYNPNYSTDSVKTFRSSVRWREWR